MPLQIDLWCDKGIPYSEIKKRLSERTDSDCLFARVVFSKYEDDIHAKIYHMCSELRDSEKVLNCFELHAIKNPKLWNNEQGKELMALYVEAAIRFIKRGYPLPSEQQN